MMETTTEEQMDKNLIIHVHDGTAYVYGADAEGNLTNHQRSGPYKHYLEAGQVEELVKQLDDVIPMKDLPQGVDPIRARYLGALRQLDAITRRPQVEAADEVYYECGEDLLPCTYIAPLLDGRHLVYGGHGEQMREGHTMIVERIELTDREEAAA